MTPFDSRGMMEEERETTDREISLSPGIVLGVFLALALVCAVFFGFGYSVGRRSVAASTPEVLATPPTVAPAVKPSPGTSSTSNKSGDKIPRADDGTPEIAQPQTEPSRIARALDARPSTPGRASASATSALNNSAVRSGGVRMPAVLVSPSAIPTPATGSPGGVIVQVAAFSHEQDAELVAGALRKRGYDVSIRQETQDKLLHVQLGPFATKKEAEGMRQRLQADGYNALVK